MNEHAHPAGPATHAEVAQFISAGRSAWNGAILTVSDSYVSASTGRRRRRTAGSTGSPET